MKINIIFLISLILVQINCQCPELYDENNELIDLIQFGNLCLTKEELQECSNNLGNLDGSETNNTSITNECHPFVKDQQQAYNFNVQFIGGFVPNMDCLEFQLKFENSVLLDGDEFYDQWAFNQTSNLINFNILHDDIENNYNCEFLQSESQYNWICDMSFHIFFGGIEQLQYDFKIQISLNREVQATQNSEEEDILVTVQRNIITGICCENELQIETAIRYCTDFSCQTFLDPPLVIQRGMEFVVEHYIVTPEFQNYYLKGIQINLGPTLATIVETNGDNPGSFIWKLKANIAMDDVLVQSISQIFTHKPEVRRFLDVDIRTGYKVMGLGQISISDNPQRIQQSYSKKSHGDNIEDHSEEEDDHGHGHDDHDNEHEDDHDDHDEKARQHQKFLAQQEKQKQMNPDNTILLIAVVSVGLLTLLSVLGALYYCIQSKLIQMQQKEQQKQKDQKEFQEANPDSVIKEKIGDDNTNDIVVA